MTPREGQVTRPFVVVVRTYGEILLCLNNAGPENREREECDEIRHYPWQRGGGRWKDPSAPGYPSMVIWSRVSLEPAIRPARSSPFGPETELRYVHYLDIDKVPSKGLGN